MSLRPPLPTLALVLVLAARAAAQAPGTPIPSPVTPPEPAAEVRVPPTQPAPVTPPATEPLLTEESAPRRELDTNLGWVTADYMLMWLRNTNTPVLATVSPAGVVKGDAGVFGAKNTVIAIGQEPFNAGAYSGLRLGGGFWFPQTEHWGAEASVFFLESRSTIFIASGSGAPGSPTLARPFVDATLVRESAALTAFENESSGTVAAALSTQLWGMEANLLYRDDPARYLNTTFLAGLRYLDLDQSFNVQEVSTPLGTNVIPFNGALAITNPDKVRITDQFHTTNRFFGAQVGARSAWEYDLLTVSVGAKVAVGTTHETLEVVGQSEALTSAGKTVATSRGGFLTNTGNIGSFSRDAFTIVPEADLKVALKLTQNLSAHLSYSFLYWSDVTNPTDQITRTVDLRRIPTSAVFDPTVISRTTTGQLIPANYWANSLQFGFTLKF